ncbi:MAG: peptidoglycan editing factor PgeF [Desulfobacteraceae bacterium]|nr:peptidoglycan editing factor PgeF [Desulfobacteraceae bacterium]
MHWIHQEKLRYLQFASLRAQASLFHGIFFRYRQSSQNQRRPFHIGLNCSESEQQVWLNRKHIKAAFGTERMVLARQVHGTKIGALHSDPAYQKAQKQNDVIFCETDALITNRPGDLLFIQVADCQPVMIADPEKKVVANIHSGWRGSIQNIIGRTIKKMIADYRCNARNLICAIGPSLGPCCAEFIHYRKEIPQRYWSYRLKGDKFDFWRISRDQMIQAGVLPENISCSQLCTRCNQHLFFSYRGQRQTGRFCSVIGLSNI